VRKFEEKTVRLSFHPLKRGTFLHH